MARLIHNQAFNLEFQLKKSLSRQRFNQENLCPERMPIDIDSFIAGVMNRHRIHNKQ
jgi:hypothetical protein